MDEKKIIKIKEISEKKEAALSENEGFSLHTNPIIKERLLSKVHDKKSRLDIKDLFK